MDKNESPTKHDPITNPFPPYMMQVQSILITPMQVQSIPTLYDASTIHYACLKSTSNARQINSYDSQDMQMKNIGTFARDV